MESSTATENRNASLGSTLFGDRNSLKAKRADSIILPYFALKHVPHEDFKSQEKREESVCATIVRKPIINIRALTKHHRREKKLSESL